jgi:YafQ family addiction module toxin component
MYTLQIRPKLEKEFAKLARKNQKQIDIILKKTEEILENPYHYKNLRSPLNSWRRVHIDDHFVLCFSIDEANEKVILEDYDHHDKIYR